MPVKNSFRGAIILQRFSTPLLVVAVALLGGEGRILMQRRRIGAEHGGLWEFPGGKVEPGESLESAALRELDEELGLEELEEELELGLELELDDGAVVAGSPTREESQAVSLE